MFIPTSWLACLYLHHDWYVCTHIVASMFVPTSQLVFLNLHCGWYVYPYIVVSMFIPTLWLVCLYQHCSWFACTFIMVGMFVPIFKSLLTNPSYLSDGKLSKGTIWIYILMYRLIAVKFYFIM